MNVLKSKLGLRQRSRFANYDISSDLADHPKIGALPNFTDFQLGTPSLSRDENITLVLSNTTSKDTLLLQLKWRPQVAAQEADQQVALTSRLLLVANDVPYELEQTECYRPVKSNIWPEHYMRYGSKNLKLFIVVPYRQMRLVFRHKWGATFIQLNLLIHITAPIFDFLRQPLRMGKSPKEALVYTDRHEHPVAATGELVIHEGQSKTRSKLMLWGFHARQFTPTTNRQTEEVSSKRLMVYMMNSQLFHIGLNNSGEHSAEVGYTFLGVRNGMRPIEKPFVINWDNVTQDEFQLEVSGEGRSFHCRAQRRWKNVDPCSLRGQFYDTEMNNKKGWAWLEMTLNPGQADESKQISRSPVHCEPSSQGDVAESGPTVVAIDDPLCLSSDLVGSKASSLAQLREFSQSKLDGCHFSVPQAFVLTRYAYDAILGQNKHLQEAIAKLETLMGEGEIDGLSKECQGIQDMFESTALVDSIRGELAAELLKHYGNDRLGSTAFAVRSSSWGEDEEDMSAAGQLRTILGVRGDSEAIARAVMACFASKFTFTNIEYKRQHGLGPNLPMAVVVQEMVACEKAGVLFTCDPTSGDPSAITITANYGLGESVVSGQSEPDFILVRAGREQDSADRTLLEIEEVKVGAKKVIIDSDSLTTSDSGQQQNESPKYDRARKCVSDDEILRLATCGSAIANYYQDHRDIEWGYKGDQLYLFQSRPITGLDAYTEHELLHECDSVSRAEVEFYSRANIGEVLPYAITPLTMTFFVQAMWNVFGAGLIQKFDSSSADYSPYAANGEILYQSYHSVFKMTSSVMFRPNVDPKQEKPMFFRTMEISFFGHEIPHQPELIEASEGLTPPKNVFQGFRYDFYSIGLKLTPWTKVLRQKVNTANAHKDVESLKYAQGYEENKMMGLLRQMRALYRLGPSPWENHIIVIMMTQENNANLSSLLARYIKDPIQLFAAMNKILANSPNVISAEIPQRIESMARLIRSKGPEELGNFLKLTESEALDYVLDKTNNEQLAAEFEQFLERFGHRCYNEFELAEKAWRESPGSIVEMLRQNCRVEKPESDKDRRDSNNLDQIIQSMNLDLSLKDQFLLRYVVGPRSQTLVALREQTKDILIYQADLVRKATRMLAREMRRQLRIPDEDLFYYLSYHELEPLIRQPQPSIILQATRRRQMFKRLFREPWKFDEIIKGPELVPNHLRPSKELDAAMANAPKLYGTPASCGRAQARVCLVLSYKELDKVKQGDILVTHSTDIGFSPVFPLLAGIITEVGGLISHGAVVAREYGLPSVLGIPDVTRILADGEEIILDADNGVIIRLNK